MHTLSYSLLFLLFSINIFTSTHETISASILLDLTFAWCFMVSINHFELSVFPLIVSNYLSLSNSCNRLWICCVRLWNIYSKAGFLGCQNTYTIKSKPRAATFLSGLVTPAEHLTYISMPHSTIINPKPLHVHNNIHAVTLIVWMSASIGLNPASTHWNV